MSAEINEILLFAGIDTHRNKKKSFFNQTKYRTHPNYLQHTSQYDSLSYRMSELELNYIMKEPLTGISL